MAWRYQCLSTLSWVHTVFSRSQPLSPQRQYSDTSVYRWYLHVISGSCRQSRDRSQSKTLREVQDHKPWPGTPIPLHRYPPRWYWNQSRTESLYHHNPQTMRHGAYSRCRDAQGSQCTLDLADNWGEKELEPEDITDYQAVVGSLMYAALATWPDISYAVAALSRYNSRPFTSHMTAAEGVLQYLKSTADFRLHYTGNGIGIGIGISIDIDFGNSLVGYSDSNWANDSVDRKSQGGHVFLASIGAISWQAWKQSLIAMWTLEAEFIACSEASREAKWLLQLQKDIHGNNLPPLPINCNNQGALTLITTGIVQAGTKHIDVCNHNSRDLHRWRIVNYSYVNTNENVADLLTKALMKDKHEKFTKAMGLG